MNITFFFWGSSRKRELTKKNNQSENGDGSKGPRECNLNESQVAKSLTLIIFFAIGLKALEWVEILINWIKNIESQWRKW